MNDKGNIAVMAALVMPIVIGGAGLGVETGYWYLQQLHLQQAADAAAYAAALEHREGEPEQMLDSAIAAAEQNGFDTETDTLDLINPSQRHPTDEGAIDIVMRREIPRSFSAIFGADPIHVSVRSTARYDASSKACLLALDLSADTGIEFQGSSTVDVAGCVIASNALSDTSIYSQGASSVTAPCLFAAGGISLSGQATMTGCSAPRANQLPFTDPYRDLVIPTAGPCSNPPYKPGRTYCGNQRINRDTHFAPGVYIFSGGEVRVNAGAALNGQDVTLVFVNGAYMHFNGNTEINLSAPTTGPYAGIVMMGSRNSPGRRIVLNGSASSQLTGTLYFPVDDLSYIGNFSGVDGCLQIVASTIAWNGNSSVSVDCSAHGMKDVELGGRPYLIG